MAYRLGEWISSEARIDTDAAYSKDYEITDAMKEQFRTSGGMAFFWKLTGWAALSITALFVALGPTPCFGLKANLI